MAQCPGFLWLGIELTKTKEPRRIDHHSCSSTCLIWDGSYLNTNSNYKAKEIFDQISSKDYSSFPIFGPSSCGKTRTVMDTLSRNWGFYFIGSKDDHGSADINALIQIVMEKIVEDPLKNNIVAKLITTCLQLARVTFLSRRLSVSTGATTWSQ
ncbi:hypothetical protein BGZ46_009964 [Entomortierella lignicola]|nr:hypothetical protein BGZ46_009964 [Entomortierella lignicola]